MRAQYTPLTPAEQLFAEEHHSLVMKYLQQKNLDPAEWYDIVIFRYLLSVKNWFSRPELQRLSFSTIAYKAMWSAVWAERQKQKRRIKTISLDEPVPGTEDLTYLDTVTCENLNYIYIGDNEMNISYNVKVPPRKRPGAKSDEVTALESFLASTEKTKNMCFEYEELKEAKSKITSLRAYGRKNNLLERIDIFRIENRIYIIKKEKEWNTK